MEVDVTTPCANCERLQEQLAAQQAQLDALTATVAQLQAQLAEARKDSSTSAKPPSSDIVKPPKPPSDPNVPKRSQGGQPGHAPHFRDLFPPAQVTATVPHRLSHCPDCGQLLEETPLPPRIVQQIDLQ